MIEWRIVPELRTKMSKNPDLLPAGEDLLFMTSGATKKSIDLCVCAFRTNGQFVR